MNPDPIQDISTLAVKVNGGSLIETSAPGFKEIEGTLRGVALSDSPVCIAGGEPMIQEQILEHLHRLSRRSHQPVYRCKRFKDVRPLMDAVLDTENPGLPLGTWVLSNVDRWKPQQQKNLEEALKAIDNDRLCGRGKHENIPRFVTVQRADKDLNELSDRLKSRLSFFQISLKELPAQNEDTEDGGRS
jgi:hypothetical protein